MKVKKAPSEWRGSWAPRALPRLVRARQGLYDNMDRRTLQIEPGNAAHEELSSGSTGTHPENF